jgi:crossover junction endodeoxyribonuclease RuvC
MLILGIDPGISGAAALLELDDDNVVRLVFALDLPTIKIPATKSKKAHSVLDVPATTSVLTGGGVFPLADAAVIEKVHAMPGQGVTSMFTFGYAAGVAAGVCGGAGIPIASLIRPQHWKRIARVPAGSDKDATRLMALDMFPDHKSLFKLKKHHGRADAMLIAYAYLCVNAGVALKTK